MGDAEKAGQGPAGDLEYLAIHAHVVRGAAPEVDVLRASKVVQVTFRSPGAVAVVVQWPSLEQYQGWMYAAWREGLTKDATTMDTLVQQLKACKMEMLTIENELRRRGWEAAR